MRLKLAVLSILVVSIVAVISTHQLVSSEQIPLSSVLPKLQAIHEDTKNLLLKNSELKAKIQAGVAVQAGQSQQSKSPRQPSNNNDQQLKTAPGLTVKSNLKPVTVHRTKPANGGIDYIELIEFNEWVDMNLDYAVKNTKASIEALKEEAQQNNGTIIYSEQAVQDGIEGVRYWQSAVIFQDKTLNNEKFDVEE